MSENNKRIVSNEEIGTVNLERSFVVSGNKIAFEDGTELVIFAKSSTPPLAELTPNEILDPFLPKEQHDRGEIEAIDIAFESDAFQVLLTLIDELKKITNK